MFWYFAIYCNNIQQFLAESKPPNILCGQYSVKWSWCWNCSCFLMFLWATLGLDLVVWSRICSDSSLYRFIQWIVGQNLQLFIFFIFGILTSLMSFLSCLMHLCWGFCRVTAFGCKGTWFYVWIREHLFFKCWVEVLLSGFS